MARTKKKRMRTASTRPPMRPIDAAAGVAVVGRRGAKSSERAQRDGWKLEESNQIGQ